MALTGCISVLLYSLRLHRRFDVHIHVDFPDEAAREQLVLDTLQKIPLDYTQDPQLADANAVAAFAAKHTSGMSAGDVRALFREAAMASMRERMDAPSVAMKFVKHALRSSGGGGGDTLSRPRIPTYRERRGRR